MTDAFIYDAVRTPRGKGKKDGSLHTVKPVDLVVGLLDSVKERNPSLDPAYVDDVVLGCVLQAGGGMNVARQAALKAGLPHDVPGETVNRVCGSGLQAVVHAVEAIRVGYVDTIVAGGTESMSNAPYMLKGARWGYRMGHAEVVDSMLLEGLTCAMNTCHMGITAEEVASRYNISRADQDAFAAESQKRAGRAIQEGAFRDEIVPVEVPQKKGDPGSETWPNEEAMRHGGGMTWQMPTYDPDLNLTYWGTGNPGPDWNGEVRKGDNLFSD